MAKIKEYMAIIDGHMLVIKEESLEAAKERLKPMYSGPLTYLDTSRDNYIFPVQLSSNVDLMEIPTSNMGN